MPHGPLTEVASDRPVLVHRENRGEAEKGTENKRVLLRLLGLLRIQVTRGGSSALC